MRDKVKQRASSRASALRRREIREFIKQDDPVMSFREIGKRIGVTSQRAQQIFAQAMRKLRERSSDQQALRLALRNRSR